MIKKKLRRQPTFTFSGSSINALANGASLSASRGVTSRFSASRLASGGDNGSNGALSSSTRSIDQDLRDLAAADEMLELSADDANFSASKPGSRPHSYLKSQRSLSSDQQTDANPASEGVARLRAFSLSKSQAAAAAPSRPRHARTGSLLKPQAVAVAAPGPIAGALSKISRIKAKAKEDASPTATHNTVDGSYSEPLLAEVAAKYGRDS
jgi:hypothetical protein